MILKHLNSNGKNTDIENKYQQIFQYAAKNKLTVAKDLDVSLGNLFTFLKSLSKRNGAANA